MERTNVMDDGARMIRRTVYLVVALGLLAMSTVFWQGCDGEAGGLGETACSVARDFCLSQADKLHEEPVWRDLAVTGCWAGYELCVWTFRYAGELGRKNTGCDYFHYDCRFQRDTGDRCEAVVDVCYDFAENFDEHPLDEPTE